jgi:hypothetical protein
MSFSSLTEMMSGPPDQKEMSYTWAVRELQVMACKSDSQSGLRERSDRNYYMGHLLLHFDHSP